MINAAEPVTRATGGGNKTSVLAPRQNGANVNSRKRQTEGFCVRVCVFFKLQNRLSPARHRRHADTRRHGGPPPCLSGALIRRNLLWGMTGECTRCCHYKSTSPSEEEGRTGGGGLGAGAEEEGSGAAESSLTVSFISSPV